MSPRVLVVAPLYHTDRGGLGRQAVLLTEHLAELGVEPLVATRLMRGLPERAFAPNVEVLHLRAGRPGVHNYETKSLRNLITTLRFSASLLRTMRRRRHGYDVIHFHGASVPLVLALPLAKLLGKRVVAKVAALHQGVEAGDLKQRYGPLGRVLAWTLGHVDTYVATTAEIGEALADEGYLPERIARIPNFVDSTLFHPPAPEDRERARRELGVESRTVVLSSGRLSQRKAGDVLLDAFARAVPRAAEASPLLVFLGDGPERSALESQAKRLGLGEAVRFVGFHDDPWRFLHAADVLVLPSLIEGLPNALLEGMACGLAVLASRIGGCVEVVRDGENGLLVPPGDRAALEEGLVRLLLDPGLRATLGQAAGECIRGGFTLNAIAPRYVELYRRLYALEGKAVSSPEGSGSGSDSGSGSGLGGA